MRTHLENASMMCVSELLVGVVQARSAQASMVAHSMLRFTAATLAVGKPITTCNHTLRSTCGSALANSFPEVESLIWRHIFVSFASACILAPGIIAIVRVCAGRPISAGLQFPVLPGLTYEVPVARYLVDLQGYSLNQVEPRDTAEYYLMRNLANR